MSIFIYKKKRFKFQVKFHLDELSSVPFVSGILFAKLRLLNGGHFVDLTPRQEVEEHSVKWNKSYTFSCKVTSNVHTAVLERCVCRVSVRKELKGGKAFQKLGYADVNLAEFAGSGRQSRCYLLEGYDSKHRQDNSTIMVTVDMDLVSGDPVFKVPTHTVGNMAMSGESGSLCELPLEGGRLDEASEGSVASGSSGFGSLTRKEKDKQALPVNTPLSESPGSSEDRASESTETFEASHTRNDSSTSQPSGYSSHSHSRQSSISASNDHIFSHHSPPTFKHVHSYPIMTSASAGSATSDLIKCERRRKYEDKERRVDATRVDAVGLVEEIMKETDFGVDDTLRPGLQLHIGKDGVPALR